MMNYPFFYPQPQIPQQGGGFIPVRSEDEARAWPVAPGSSVTFRDETRSYCYEKSLGLSQFDQPVFRRYRMVLEQDAPERAENSFTRSEGNDIGERLKAIEARLSALEKEDKE